MFFVYFIINMKNIYLWRSVFFKIVISMFYVRLNFKMFCKVYGIDKWKIIIFFVFIFSMWNYLYV